MQVVRWKINDLNFCICCYPFTHGAGVFDVVIILQDRYRILRPLDNELILPALEQDFDELAAKADDVKPSEIGSVLVIPPELPGDIYSIEAILYDIDNSPMSSTDILYDILDKINSAISRYTFSNILMKSYGIGKYGLTISGFAKSIVKCLETYLGADECRLKSWYIEIKKEEWDRFKKIFISILGEGEELDITGSSQD